MSIGDSAGCSATGGGGSGTIRDVDPPSENEMDKGIGRERVLYLLLPCTHSLFSTQKAPTEDESSLLSARIGL